MQKRHNYTPDEILKLVQEFKEPFRLWPAKKTKDIQLPGTYNFTVELMDSCRVHAEKGFFPEKLFAERSPNETDAEAKYRKANYKQITLPLFSDFNATVARSFHDTNWSIEYTEDAEQYKEMSFQKYVEKEIDNYGSIENYFKTFLIPYKLIDANGVVAVKPEHLPMMETEEGEMIDDTELIEPLPFYYSARQVMAFEEGYYALLMTDERVNVIFGNTMKPMGYVFEFYDENTIYRVIQTGKYTDWTFSVQIFFQHNWDRLPVEKLKGVPFLKDGKVIYQSPFSYAVDNLDIALLNNSNLQIATSRCAFPTPVMYGSVCDFEDNLGHKCNDGRLAIDGVWKDCPKCNGTGLKTRLNPMGTILLKPPTREDSGDASMSQAPLEYVSPSSEILTFLENSIDKNIQKAAKILHLRDSDTPVVFNETATASNNDLKATYAFIKPISDQIFALYEFVLEAIGWMRYGENFTAPTVHYPMAFDFKTEGDYLMEINNAVKVGLPSFALHKILFNYLNTIFFTEKESAQALNLIVSADRLFGMTNDEIAMKTAKNLIAPWEDLLHQSGFIFIQELVRENPNFWEQEMSAQIEQLKAKAKAKETELKPLTPAASAVASIMNQ